MKSLIKLAIFLCFLSIPVFAQDAKVVQLKREDAIKAQEKYSDLQIAQAAWDKEQEEIKQKYIIVDRGDKDKGNLQIFDESNNKFYREGFENGFVFSKDFLYVVPKPASTVPVNCSYSGMFMANCTIWNASPAISTQSDGTFNENGIGATKSITPDTGVLNTPNHEEAIGTIESCN